MRLSVPQRRRRSPRSCRDGRPRGSGDDPGPILEDAGEQLDLEASGDRQSVLRLTEEHSGPLPHPNTLQRYDEIVPGSAAQIIGVYVDEANTRNEVLTRLSKAEARAVSIGSVTTAFLVIGGLLAIVVLVATGNLWAGLIAGLVTAGSAGLAK